jgi:hypothetical protein
MKSSDFPVRRLASLARRSGKLDRGGELGWLAPSYLVDFTELASSPPILVNTRRTGTVCQLATLPPFRWRDGELPCELTAVWLIA